MKVVCETKLCVKKGHCLWPCCPGGTRLPCSPCSIRCAAGGKAPVPLQTGKALRAALYQKAASRLKSGIPSDPGDCRAAAFLVTCSPEAEKRVFLPLPVLGWFMGDMGANSVLQEWLTPPCLKIARSLTKHFTPLPRPSSLGNVCPVQGSSKCFSHPNPCWNKLTPVVFLCC